MANIVQLMKQKGLLQEGDLQKILSTGTSSESVYKLAIRTGMVSEDDFLALASQEYGIPIYEKLDPGYDPEPFRHISPLFMEEHVFFPLEARDNTFSFVLNDPFDNLIYETLKQIYPGYRFTPHLAREERIRTWITTYFMEDDSAARQAEEEEDSAADLAVSEDVEHLRDLASEAPIIKKVNQFLTKAVELEASDIHVEPFNDHVHVRFRIDGMLHEHETLPSHLQQAVATRIKIMSKLDISERRLPQDGRIRLKISGKNIDLRVSSLPTMYGESIVLRILDRSSISFTLESLGFPEEELRAFERLIHQPYGILLVTGPTGSGKTTTLYSALNAINSTEKKIITIEDPVEYELDGINQVQVNVKAGLKFASGLRSVVRQDPDVILIGEIRDKETADIAVQSALTGHLVFSTLHTNDSASSITRLMEIGVEDYLISSAVIGVMAQRLVRLLCPECKEPYVPDEALVYKLKLPFLPTEERPVYRSRGCEKCARTGYRGRTAIFELMEINDEIRNSILQNKSSVDLRNLAVHQGMRMLRSDGMEKVRKGLTSVEEVLRVTGM